MISVTELRAGTGFVLDSKPYRVIQYKHIKMGRGTANIRVKVKNLLNSAIEEKTFISGARVEPLELEFKEFQFLYKDGQNYYFADPKTFEQFSLTHDAIREKGRYLKEGQEVRILLWENRLLDIELPISLVFTVIQTAPGVKGNSVVSSFKPAVLENGMTVKVPLFINAGDKIKVDTRTGEYIERAK